MQRTITGFFKNDRDHWTAQLDCGHTQIIRHNPPWVNRRWVLREETRRQRVGTSINCKACDDAPGSRTEQRPAGGGPTVRYRGRRTRGAKAPAYQSAGRGRRS